MSTRFIGKDFDCNQLKELLPDYLDRTLQDRVCTELQAHLDECEDCRIFVKTVEQTIILYKHHPDSDVPEEVRIELRHHLRAHIEKGSGEDDRS